MIFSKIRSYEIQFSIRIYDNISYKLAAKNIYRLFE